MKRFFVVNLMIPVETEKGQPPRIQSAQPGVLAIGATQREIWGDLIDQVVAKYGETAVIRSVTVQGQVDLERS